jgi:thiamine-phosphate pyrophosphorylase
MFILPKIYPITDVSITQLPHPEQCRRLIKGGANFIQIREKSALSDEFYEAAKQSLEIAEPDKAKIIINDRVDIALTVKAAGVHLGQDDLPPEKAREILGSEAIIGFSTHTIKQASAAIKLPVDYIAIGPVFATSTKKNPDDVIGLEGLAEIRRIIGSFPLVAIGGIDFSNYQMVLDAGADSVAIISGLLSDPEKISENFQKFRAVESRM